MFNNLVVDCELYSHEDLYYSSITFAPLPEAKSIEQAMINLSKHIEWVDDFMNDLKGQNNSLLQGSKLILLWKENKNYNIKLEKILTSDSYKKIYEKMLKLSIKKGN